MLIWLKRQKIIEETRKKEIEKRTKPLLEEQQNSVLQTKKKEKTVSFETIKDISNSNEEKNIENNEKQPMNIIGEVEDSNLSVKNEIENDLFEEFNNKANDHKPVSDDVFERLDETMRKENFPKMSLDEYMNNFSGDNTDSNELFNTSTFPSIPM